jgi:hypothetical protein
MTDLAYVPIPPGRKTKPQPGDKQYGRSKVTNGKSHFVEHDRRGP